MNSPGLSATGAVHPYGVYSPHIRQELKNLASHIQSCADTDPTKAVITKDQDTITGCFLPAELIALLGAEEFTHRAAAILPPILEPIAAIQGMTKLMKKGLPKVTHDHPDDILTQSAASGSEQLFVVPFEYGLRPSETKVREFLATANGYADENLKSQAERREDFSKGLAEPIPPEDWKKWMTLLKLRKEITLKRMEGVPRRYEKARQFIQNLKDKLAEKRQNKLVTQLENETQTQPASSSKSKSAKRKARQKERKAQAQVIAAQANPSPSQSSLNNAAQTRQNPTAFSLFQLEEPPRSTPFPNPPSEKPAAPIGGENAQATPSFEEKLRAALASHHRPSRPLQPLENFNIQEAQQLMQDRWDAAWGRANNHEGGVVIYSGND